MFKSLGASALLALTLAACGGGGSTSAGGGLYGGPPPVNPTTAPTTAPTIAPTTAPTTPPAGAPLQTATILGSPGFVNANQRTVYVFDADLGTPNASTCSGVCAQNWPPVTIAAGTNLPAPFSSFQRADGTTQLAYKTRALYTFAFDTAPGQATGDLVNAFGGVWHVARP